MGHLLFIIKVLLPYLLAVGTHCLLKVDSLPLLSSLTPQEFILPEGVAPGTNDSTLLKIIKDTPCSFLTLAISLSQ